MPSQISLCPLSYIDEFFRPSDRHRRRRQLSNLEKVRDIAKLIRLAGRLEEAERQAAADHG